MDLCAGRLEPQLGAVTDQLSQIVLSVAAAGSAVKSLLAHESGRSTALD